MRAILLAMSLSLTPGLSAAQLAVNGPEGCALIAGASDGAVFMALDEDHLIFDGASLEGVEWHCGFEAAFGPADDTVQIRAGYCMEPGPFVTPGVFTLFDRGDGTAQLDGSDWDMPLILDICPSP
jgi:hypothetical protein